LNVEKLGVGTYDEAIHYLGFDWQVDDQPYATEEWILGRICYPERYSKLPGRIRTYQRFCAICFQSADGARFYHDVLGRHDPYFRKQFYGKEHLRDPLISYIDKEKTSFSFKIPLTTLLNKGWKAF
jgi:hypothetical protein